MKFILAIILVGVAILAACRPDLATTPGKPTATTLEPPATGLPAPASPGPVPTSTSAAASPVAGPSKSSAITASNATGLVPLRTLGFGTVSGFPLYSPDGKLLAVPTAAGIQLFDSETNDHLHHFPAGPGAGILAFSPDSSQVASLEISSVQVWLIETGEGTTFRTAKPDLYPQDLAYSPDGSLIAACFLGGDMLAWEVPGGAIRYSGPECTHLAFSPDARWLAAEYVEGIGDPAPEVRLYYAGTGELARSLSGQHPVFASTGVLSVERQGATRLYDLEQGSTPLGINGTSAAFSPDGQYLAVYSLGFVQVFSVADGALVSKLDVHLKAGGLEAASLLRFSPNGRYLAGLLSLCEYPDFSCAFSEPAVAVWSLSNGSVVALHRGEQSYPWFAFTPNMAAWLAAGAEKVEAHSLVDGSLVDTAGDYSAGVAGLAFSPAGDLLAVAGGDNNQALVWKINPPYRSRPADPKGEPVVIHRLNTPGGGSAYFNTDVAFSPSGDVLVVRDDFWHLPDGKRLERLEQTIASAGPTFVASAAAFSSQGLLAIGYLDSQLQVWDTSQAELVIRLAGVEPYEYGPTVASLAFSPDGQTLAAVYTYPDQSDRLVVYAIATALPQLVVHIHDLARVIFSPDGKTLALLAPDPENLEYGQSAGSVKLISALDGSPLGELSVPPAGLEPVGSTYDPRAIVSLSFSPDGSLLATGSGDGSLRIWRISEHSLLATLQVQSSTLPAIQFSPDGTILATGSMDGTVALWGFAQ